MKTISNFLKGNNKINWLNLGNNSLGLNAEENLKLIFEGLNGNKNLKKLSLSENILVLLMNTLNLYRDKFNEAEKEQFRKINLNEKTKDIFWNYK